MIIPVLNDAQRLAVCLRALEDQTYPQASYEVIVVDNNSAESIAPVVSRFNHALVVEERRPGSYAARNRGLTVARGSVVAFTDADCIPARDWLEKGVGNLLRAPGCGLVAGRIEIFFKDPARPTAVELYEKRIALAQRRYVEIYGFGATANVFTFRRTFEEAGLFIEELKSGGDLEWSRRVAEGGRDVIYAADTLVRHPARSSLSQLYRKLARSTGGLYDLKRLKGRRFVSFDRSLLVDALPPVRAVVNVFRESCPGTTSEKLKVAAIICFARYVQFFEKLRLALGARSKG